MSTRRFITILAAAFVCVLFDAAEADAWGAATHAKLATDVLSQLGMLPAAVAGLLARYGSSYLFGNIAADVVFAKRFSRLKQRCHHWSTGFGFLDRASHDRDRAFALGYLSHLAADTVAHGKFVPRQLGVTQTTLNFGHIYWEMRADALIEPGAWAALNSVVRRDHDHHHHVLARGIGPTLLPYRVNRHLFERINALVVRRYWSRCMHILHAHSRWELRAQLLGRYHDEGLDRIASVLCDLERSPVLREDPSGVAALHQVRLHRRDNRRLHRRGICTLKRRDEAAASLAPVGAPSFAIGEGWGTQS